MATPKKKAAPMVKKSISKKAAVQKVTSGAKKAAANKTFPTLAKKTAAKKTAAGKKSTSEVAHSSKKISKPIIKSASAKKSAKSGVKKAAPKNLTNSTKKTGAKKSVTPDKKTATSGKKTVSPGKKPLKESKKEIESKSKTSQHKAAEKVVSQTPVVHMTDHKKELKKALTKAKTNEVGKKAEKPFVMPKTSTEKARKYEPQFIKSVLDQAPEEDNGPTMRYSDNELTEFKELISRKLETAKKELGYLQGLITRKDEMGGDDTDNRYMTMEDGSLSMEREQLSQMASRQITFIDHLEKAMMRIENKTYGICRVTGKLIDKARLRAVPHATLSIEAKMGIAK
jgi:RNA polymerase-binding transcription factor DksA